MSVRAPRSPLFLVGLLALMPGCVPRVGASDSGSPPVLVNASLTVPRSAADWDQAVERAVRLLPKAEHRLNADGIGLVVCDPSPGTPAELADFGRGCSRWLHLTVAGRPELNLTPLLSSLSRTRREFRKKDLGLTADEAGGLVAPLGINRVVMVRLEGTRGAAKLTCTLRKLPGIEPLGEPIELTGTMEGVATGLPQAAAELCNRLEIPSTGITPQTGLTAEELAQIGAVWWNEAEHEKVSAALASAHPLAGVLRLGAAEAAELRTLAPRLLQAAPDNTLVYGAVGYHDAQGLTGAAPRLLGLRRLHPMSYALAHSEVWLQRARKNVSAEEAAAHAVVKNAPRNPDSWLSLAYTLSSAAEKVRKGRYGAHIAGAEWDNLEKSYALQLLATAESVRLDPRYAYGWSKLAADATFASEPDLADAALWASLKLDPDRFDAYHWGLQMYQPKWFDNAEKLRQVAQAAADREWPADMDLSPTIRAIEQAGLKEIAAALTSRTIARCEAALKQIPDDAVLHYCLAAALERDGKGPMARREWKETVRLAPENASAHFNLADNLDKAGQNEAAEKEYLEVIRLDPSYRDVHYDLAWLYKEMGRFSDAEREFRVALRHNPDSSASYYGLGRMAEERGNKKAARDHYRVTVRVQPTHFEGLYRLALLLSEEGEHDAAVRAARMATEVKAEDSTALNALAHVLGKAGRSKECAEVSQHVLDRDANDSVAQVNLGESLCKMGQKSEGRALLEKARSSSPDASVRQEAERLLEALR